MKLKEIVGIEAISIGKTYLYKEGLFWRAYEVSAYLFVSYIKAYQATKKYYKVVEDDVIYIGFPHSQIKRVSGIHFNIKRRKSDTSCYRGECRKGELWHLEK